MVISKILKIWRLLHYANDVANAEIRKTFLYYNRSAVHSVYGTIRF